MWCKLTCAIIALFFKGRHRDMCAAGARSLNRSFIASRNLNQRNSQTQHLILHETSPNLPSASFALHPHLLHHNPPPILSHTSQPHATQVSNHPIRPRIPQPVHRVRSRERQDRTPGRPARPDASGRILHDEHRRPLPSRAKHLLAAEPVAGRVRLAGRDIFRRDRRRRRGKAQEVEPAGQQGAGAGRDDGPGGAGFGQGVEQGPSTGDWGCGGAVCGWDLAFDVADVCCWWWCVWLARSIGDKSS